MAQAAWSIGEKPLDSLEEVQQDPSWKKVLPPGSEVTSTEPSGAASFWSRTARINTRSIEGEEKSYFFKLMDGPRGRLMAEGEYASMHALHSVAPEMVPKPLGWGTLETNPNSHFFLCEFVNLADEIPDPSSICQALADLHRRSITISPNGMFGFPVTTCNGTFPQDNRWNKSWESFFAQQTRDAFEAEQEVHGVSEDYQRLLPAFFEKVVPRLLRPLETGGNDIKPILIHGDLWDGNVSFHAETDQFGPSYLPYIYDASAFWGHNEYDLHNWRAARFKLRKSFVKEYFKNFPMSPPQEDWDDRNLLYSIRADLHSSYLHPSTKRFRALIVGALEELVAKFPNGYEGGFPCKGGNMEARRPAATEDNSQPAPISSSSTTATSGLYDSPEDGIGSVEGKDEHSHMIGITPQPMDNTADSLGMVVSSPGHTDRDVRFGESAISPMGGSEASVQLP